MSRIIRDLGRRTSTSTFALERGRQGFAVSSGLEGRTACSPSPRPSPPGRGGLLARCLANPKRFDLNPRGNWFSLSQRERAGVRGKTTVDRLRLPRCRNLLAAVMLCGVTFISYAAPSQASQSAKRPNVIIVLTDDQGYGDFSCHGNPVLKTPNLDKLHDQSIRFTDFHVAPMCTPTRGQLLSGRDCLANGAMNVSSGRTFLRRELPTMADIFAANGYRCGQFGKWHLGDNYPYRPQDRGFHEAI